MKKSLAKTLFVIIAVALGITAFAGCQDLGEHIPIDYDIILQIDCLSDVDTSGWQVRTRPQLSGTLRITFFDGGFGRAWIDEIASQFRLLYPNVTVNLQSSQNVANIIEAELSGNNFADIYISHNLPWNRMAGRGQIANLNNLFTSVVYTDSNDSSNPVRFRDRIASSALRTTLMRDRDGNVGHWQVPFVMGAGGLAYNAALFEANGWEVPETVEELFALADTIANANVPTRSGRDTVRPFVWSSSEYLWDSVVFDWWAQLASINDGDTSIIEFNRYRSAQQFNPEYWPELKTAWTAWHDLIAVPGNINSVPHSTGFTDLVAQTAFVQGYAAMMPAASWLVNELGLEIINHNEADIRLMPTPFINGAREDEYGNPIRVSNVIEYNQNIVVAARSQNMAAAEEFLRFMTERDISLIFPANTNGALFAHRYDLEDLMYNAASEWERSMYDVMSTSLRFSTWSDNPRYVLTPAGPFPNRHGYIRAANNPNAVTPETFFNERWDLARNNWARWGRDAGIL